MAITKLSKVILRIAISINIKREINHSFTIFTFIKASKSNYPIDIMKMLLIDFQTSLNPSFSTIEIDETKTKIMKMIK